MNIHHKGVFRTAYVTTQQLRPAHSEAEHLYLLCSQGLGSSGLPKVVFSPSWKAKEEADGIDTSTSRSERWRATVSSKDCSVSVLPKDSDTTQGILSPLSQSFLEKLHRPGQSHVSYLRLDLIKLTVTIGHHSQHRPLIASEPAVDESKRSRGSVLLRHQWPP